MTPSLISLVCLQCDGAALEANRKYFSGTKSDFLNSIHLLPTHTPRYVAKIQSNLTLNGVFPFPSQLKALRHNFDKLDRECFLDGTRSPWLLWRATVHRQTKSAIVKGADPRKGEKVAAHVE